ncbi:nitronate monooxygenase [Clostridiaceae bacterium M8S5]|nr:nitronate monooxygenase [Clostridiaceae bacterium M8S5]
MKLPSLNIGNINLRLPIIQGGMGIGISRSSLASSISNEGGLGVISAAQIGYDESDFKTNTLSANLRALSKEIKKAKELTSNGAIGVNIMVAMKNYAEIVKTAVKEKVDVIISGAGLPTELPALVKGSNVKIVPIVSSLRAAKIIVKRWLKKHDRYPDAIIVEGPKAGGHLGFSVDELDTNIDLKQIVSSIVDYVKDINIDIPVIAAGGVYTGEDIAIHINNGASGVQMSTRFVTTEECDAHRNYKQAYIDASKDDIVIVKSPVGMPARAIKNNFIKQLELDSIDKITKCYHCLLGCDPSKIPYCITDKLINAVKGNVDKGLIFVGSNAYLSSKIETVKDVFDQLKREVNETFLSRFE